MTTLKINNYPSTEKSFIPKPQYEKEPLVLTPRGKKLVTGIGLLAAGSILAGAYNVASNNTTETLSQNDMSSQTSTEVTFKNIDDVKAEPGDSISSLVSDYVDVVNKSTAADYVAFDATVDKVVDLNKDGALADNILQAGEKVEIPNKAVVTDEAKDINE
jgi:hypothetical protein